MMERALRTIALLIVAAAIIDPAIQSRRGARPVIAVVAASDRDSADAERVVRSLSQHATVVRGVFGGAAATVLVGDGVPAAADAIVAPVFGIVHNASTTRASIVGVRNAEHVGIDARVPIVVFARITGAAGRSADVALDAGGVTVDRASRRIASNDEYVRVPLTFVPSVVGLARLRATIALDGIARDVSDLVVDVSDQRSNVLFLDRRPSWMSTFVRRAVERDPRFVVTSRIATSRGISTDAGSPPSALSDVVALGEFSAVVVGAPDALTESDVAGLETFLRERGGAVILLLDERKPGPYEKLAGVREWLEDNKKAVVVANNPTESDTLRATDVVAPVSLPLGAHALATSATAGGASHAAVWSSPVGVGTLVVSGALDAWTARAPETSDFDVYWQTLIADAARRTPDAIHVSAPTIAAPGDAVDVMVHMRDAYLRAHESRAAVRATVEYESERVPLQLWPTAQPGILRGSFRVPSNATAARVVAVVDGARGEANTLIVPHAHESSPVAPQLATAWIASRGGRTYDMTALDQMRRAIDDLPGHDEGSAPWHPMRSALWIIPFALALGAEWWMRRRRGLA